MALSAMTDEELLEDIRSMEQASTQMRAEIKRRVLAAAERPGSPKGDRHDVAAIRRELTACLIFVTGTRNGKMIDLAHPTRERIDAVMREAEAALAALEKRTMTERQAAAWPGAIADAQQYVDTSTITPDLDHFDWRVHWEDESRPGRGHMLRAVWCDGEYLVEIAMDVYGSPTVAVSGLSWLHNSSDEECNCERCTTERQDGGE